MMMAGIASLHEAEEAMASIVNPEALIRILAKSKQHQKMIRWWSFPWIPSYFRITGRDAWNQLTRRGWRHFNFWTVKPQSNFLMNTLIWMTLVLGLNHDVGGCYLIGLEVPQDLGVLHLIYFDMKEREPAQVDLKQGVTFCRGVFEVCNFCHKQISTIFPSSPPFLEEDDGQFLNWAIIQVTLPEWELRLLLILTQGQSE